MNTKLPPDERAKLIEGQMTRAEKFQLVHGYFASSFGRKDQALPKGALGSAGFIPGIEPLGIPALQESDTSLGPTNPQNMCEGDGATALPSSPSSKLGLLRSNLPLETTQ